MTYAVSDIHGCFEEYMDMIELIHLGDNDTLYVLGDVVDRGKDGIKVLLDMMNRPNVIPLAGNHDYMAAVVLNKLCAEITEENADNYLDAGFMRMYTMWIADGGETTLTEFRKLTPEQKPDVLDYLSDFLPFEELDAGGNRFTLVHAGLMNFSQRRNLNDYALHELIFERTDYTKLYYSDRYLVTGHTPTMLISNESSGRIYKANNHIAIDCGVIYGGRLAAICLDTMEEFYVRRASAP